VLCVLASMFSRPAFADGVPFSIGDIFAGTGSGTILHYNKNFTLEDTLTTTLGHEQTGMAFDKSLNLYATNFQGGVVSKFSSDGKLVSASFVINDAASNNESIVFDKSGNFYVGQAEGTHDILKRAPDGTLLTRYSGLAVDRGTDWIQLSPDQKTIYYTGDGKTVRRLDTATGKQLANFPMLPGPNAYALQFLPNGNLLVADGDRLVELSTSGTVIKTFTPPGAVALYSLALDPSGTTFLAADNNTGHIFRFNIATGALLQDFATGAGEIAGLAVAGGFVVGPGGGPGGAPGAAGGASSMALGTSAPVHFTLVDVGAMLSATASALPVALSQRENLLSVNRTVISDINARLFRLRSRFDAPGAHGESGKEIAEPGKELTNADGGISKMIAPANPRRVELFGAGNFGFQNLHDIGASSGFDFDSQAATAGLEYRATDELALGLAGSYVDSHSYLAGRLGKADTQGYALSTYASFFSRNFFADVLYAFSDFEDDIFRNTLLGQTARATPHSRNHNIYFNTGYNLKVGPALTGPIGALEYVNGHLDAYGERGGGSAAIQADGQNYDSLISRLGWQLSIPAATSWGDLTLQLRASWDHQYLDASDQVNVSLAQSPITTINGTQASAGGKFTASGRTAPPGRDYLTLGGGILVNLCERGQIVLDYEAHLAQTNNVEQFVSITLGCKF
jgi:sugar lactone lactonase YvrE